MIRKITPERLSFFSDGVFAVLITILVLELHPPAQPTFEALLEHWSSWLSYAVSYLFIAIVWANHHYLLHHATEATLGSCGSTSLICSPHRGCRYRQPGWRQPSWRLSRLRSTRQSSFS